VCVTSAQLHDVQDFNNTAQNCMCTRWQIGSLSVGIAQWRQRPTGACVQNSSHQRARTAMGTEGAHGVGACAISACSTAGRFTRAGCLTRDGELHMYSSVCMSLNPVHSVLGLQYDKYAYGNE
jgi:hypothetical protein